MDEATLDDDEKAARMAKLSEIAERAEQKRLEKEERDAIKAEAERIKFERREVRRLKREAKAEERRERQALRDAGTLITNRDFFASRMYKFSENLTAHFRDKK